MNMERLIDVLGMLIGGWLGWALGARISVFTAFMLGIVGTGMGLYAARRFAAAYLP